MLPRSMLVLALSCALAAPTAGLATSPPASDPASEGLVAESGASSDAAAQRELVRRVAARSGISRASARRVVADPSARIAEDGSVHFVEDWHPHEDRSAPAPIAASSDEVLTRHSRPGADQTIYLDFDGAELAGSLWNGSDLPAGTYAGWSLDDDPAFSPRELAFIDRVWRETAEKFAPFDVDVTTERPADHRLIRADEQDRVFGSWVFVTHDERVQRGSCFGAGGCAYLGIHDDVVGEMPTPALSFFADSPIITHELGHQLGLAHDGSFYEDGSLREYYPGHGDWQPVMGAGGRKPLLQWSRGEYAGASNTEDDYEVMAANGLVTVPDEAPAVPADAPAAPAGQVLLGPHDVDVFALPACDGTVLTVAEVEVLGNIALDVDLSLLDAAGDVLVSDERSVLTSGVSFGWGNGPVSGASAWGAAPGVEARYVRVSPGSEPGQLGYTPYGSVGSYHLRVACDPGRPDPPVDLRVSAGARPYDVVVSWEAPSGPITGYEVTVGDGEPELLDAGARSHETTAWGLGDAQVRVVALRGASNSAPAEGAVTPIDRPEFEVEEPVVDEQTGVVDVRWTDVRADARLPDPYWSVEFGSLKERVPFESRGLSVRVSDLPSSTESVGVCLIIPVTELMTFRECRYADLHLAPRPSEPTDLSWPRHVVPLGDPVDIRWGPPTDLAGQSLIGYEYALDGGEWLSTTGTSLRLTELSRGEHELTLRAVTPEAKGASARLHLSIGGARPGRVRDLTAEIWSEGTVISLSWLPPTGAEELEHYQVRRYAQHEASLDLEDEVFVGLGYPSWSFSGLTPGTRHYLEVYAVNRWGTSQEPSYLWVDLPTGDDGGDDGGGDGGDDGGGEPPLAAPAVESLKLKAGRRGGARTLVARWVAETGEGVAEADRWQLKLVGKTVKGKGKARRKVLIIGDLRRLTLRLPATYRWRGQLRSVQDTGERGSWSSRTGYFRPR